VDGTQRPEPKPFHFLLLAVYPVLALTAANAEQIALKDAFRPLVLSLMLALAAFAVYRLLLRDSARAALATSITVLMLLSYGHLYNALKLIGVSGLAVRHRFLLPLIVAAILLGAFLIARKRPSPLLTSTLNWIAVIAVALPVASLALTSGRSILAYRQTGLDKPGCALHPPPGTPLPDVYFIVMDAYERDDVLREMHGADITPFIEWLEERGFYVARGAMANYRHTELSLSSTLNMEYVQTLLGTDSPDIDEGRWRLVKMIPNNRLRHELECLGYKTVGIETGISWTEWRNASYFIARDSDPLHNAGLVGAITPFESQFLDTTIARAVLDGFRTREGSAPPAIDPNEGTRQRILFALDQLQRVPLLPSPKLVFVHVLSPHPPFVFGPNGEPISKANFETIYGGPGESGLLEAYADQVAFLNTKLQEAVTAILASSPTSPVIVIEGDHGWADRNHEDKLSNFNAIHLPNGDDSALYPTLSPVNTFRIVLDESFGGDYPQLPDTSYYSPESNIFEFTPVPNTWTPQAH
jgi:hypothetical protein